MNVHYNSKTTKTQNHVIFFALPFHSRVGHALQFIPQELVSDTVDSGRGLIWFDLHHYPLQELEGILHGSWILKVNAVDDPQKHGEAGWHILEVV